MFQTQQNAHNPLYSLEPLPQDSGDYKLIEKSFMNTSSVKRGRGHPSCNFAIEAIYRINPVVAHKTIGNRMGSILVFHGTPGLNVEGILRYGFRPSTGLV